MLEDPPDGVCRAHGEQFVMVHLCSKLHVALSQSRDLGFASALLSMKTCIVIGLDNNAKLHMEKIGKKERLCT